jgi:hypothetical protein
MFLFANPDQNSNGCRPLFTDGTNAIKEIENDLK